MKPVHLTIAKIEAYTPGRTAIAGQQQVIKLSSNENALGASPAALEEAAKALHTTSRYPDGGARELRDALAEKHGLKAEQIVCGTGSGELLMLLAEAYAGEEKEVMYSRHGFLMYPIAAHRAGAKTVEVIEKNLQADLDAMSQAITPNTRIVFLANPNNPTGSYVPYKTLEAFAKALPKHVLLAVDEAYAEFADAPDYNTALPLIAQGNVAVFRTFSKLYGLAALRVGWMAASEEIIDILHRIRPPFNVSSAAQAAALAALKDEGFAKKSYDHNTKWRSFLDKELSTAGLKTYPSQANFILAEHKDIAALDSHLQKHGIIVRRMESYHLPYCVRITIGTEEENQRLVEAVKSF